MSEERDQKTTEGAASGPRSSNQIAAELGVLELSFRRMTEEDCGDMLEFARMLAEHDLLFLRRDITDEEVIEDWGRQLEDESLVTVLAVADDTIVGYATVDRSRLRWSAHVAELRVVVAEHARGKSLGRRLIQEAFSAALEMGIEKMIARMTTDQKGAIAAFEGLGFRAEGLLRSHVKDLAGEKHDLVVMGLDVESFHRTLESYGVPENLES